MTRILYPVLTEPVLTAAQQPEQVTESRWHQPLSQPVLRGALSAAILSAGLFWSGFTPAQAETITLDKWFHPLEQPAPIPRRLSEYPALAYSYAVVPAGIDGWGQPLAQPVLRKGPAASLIEASGENWAPRLPDLSLLWQQPLSLPTARIAPQFPAQIGPLFVSPPETITLDKWYHPFGVPVRYQRTAEYPALTYSYAIVSAPVSAAQTAIHGNILTPTRWIMGR